jgi:hypothetical protein
MADHELIEEHERDRFEGTSAMSTHRDRDETNGRGTLDDDEYRRGRRDEAVDEAKADENNRPARFDRDTAAESAEQRSQRH